MQTRRFAVAFVSAWLLLGLGAGARTEARTIDEPALDAAAIREMLEGPSGRREAWAITPTLVVLASVVDYARGDLPTGFPVTNRRLTSKEIEQLRVDLTAALVELSDGRLTSFHDVVVETPEPGARVVLFQPGRIVVGRFRGLQKQTSNLGYGGRATRRSGTISGAAIMLDERADLDTSQRGLTRTHELGHALGFNHVTSRPSVMNPTLGSGISQSDRAAIRQLGPQAFGLN